MRLCMWVALVASMSMPLCTRSSQAQPAGRSAIPVRRTASDGHPRYLAPAQA